MDNKERPQFGMFALQVLQLALVLALAHIFLIEQTYGFGRLIPVIFFGFIVHAWLPLRWRGWFFVLLFPVCAVALLGPIPGAMLVTLSVALFLLCHLPISLPARAAVLVLVGIGLAAIRAGVVEIAVPQLQMYVQTEKLQLYLQTQTLPIVGAIFMFRTVIYLYDLRHEKGPVPLSQRLGYFFLFPNICFPLFPVIDYQTFKRTYFDRAQPGIYQKGIDWILRGITHLLLYRIVYHYFVPDPLAISDLAGVGQYVLSSFLLYLRVSGLFHLVIGILCLFGYNLPETHHRYYLAESFTDFWRRINIYWKDFMVKVFYFPMFMALRRWGVARAMITATLATFFITWLLHSYQWFWLRGTFPLHPQDMIFWGVLAVFVTANSLFEEKYGRKRRSLTRNDRPTLRDALGRSVRTVSVFSIICLLWSFWTSTSVDQWLAVVSIAGTASLIEWVVVGLVFVLAISIGVLAQLVGRPGLEARPRETSIPFRTAWVGVTSIVLLAVAYPGVGNWFDPRAANMIAAITGDRLNARDEQQLVKGYYEELLGAESSGAMAWSVRAEQPKTWRWNGHPGSEYWVETPDLRGAVMRPHIDAIDKGETFRTNQWGMRDREYEREKAVGTFRIAMLGSSHTLGAGVAVESTFPWLVEQQLNSGDTNFRHAKVELLNMASGADSILRRAARFQKDALPFDIDLVCDMAITSDAHLAVRNLREAVRDRTPNLDSALLDIVQRAAVTPEMTDDAIESRLGPFAEEILRFGFQQLALTAKQNGVAALVFVLPRVEDTEEVYGEAWETLSKLVREAGLTAISLEGAYARVNDKNTLELALWDRHPNAEGHALLADRIYQELMSLDYFATKADAADQVSSRGGPATGRANN